MLTLSKIQTYERFGGDLDGFERSRRHDDTSGITNEDWALIDQFRQSLYLVASHKASDNFGTEVEQKLHALTADDLTRDALRRLALS